jgi:sugar phosphate isomerase/epimerase
MSKPERKEILIPGEAGPVLMERYGLFCEFRGRWGDAASADCADRIRAARAPSSVELKGRARLVNVASPNAQYRAYSLGVIEEFIRGVVHAPECRLIVLPSAPRFWDEDAGQACSIREVGQYGCLIESLKRLSIVAREAGVSLAVENHWAPWTEIADDQDFHHDVHHGKTREFFASAPKEWAGIPEDVAEPELGLCLDTSHAVTYAHRFPLEAREGMLGLYLTLAGGRLWHVIWSDNRLASKEGRRSLRLHLGKGDIPRRIHGRLWETPSAKTYAFPHWDHEGELADDLRFVERL